LGSAFAQLQQYCTLVPFEGLRRENFVPKRTSRIFWQTNTWIHVEIRSTWTSESFC